MSEPKHIAGQEVRLYFERANEMLDVAGLNLAEGYYGSAINRAYSPFSTPPMVCS